MKMEEFGPGGGPLPWRLPHNSSMISNAINQMKKKQLLYFTLRGWIFIILMMSF